MWHSELRLRIYDVTGAEARVPRFVCLQVACKKVVSGLNRLCRVIGTGAFHAGVEAWHEVPAAVEKPNKGVELAAGEQVYGLEWSFGFTDDGSGVFSCHLGMGSHHCCVHPLLALAAR